MAVRENGWRLSNVDGPEEIVQCLNCKWPSCVNCIGTKRNQEREARRAANGYVRKYKHKTTFYYVDGVRVNEKAIELLNCYASLPTDDAISKAISVTSGTVCSIRKRLGLPRADTPVEEKTRLVNKYLDRIKNMEAC